jgi:2-dehydro-3-deoxygluconokinase
VHLTGITPALSPNCAEICRRLVDAAAAANVPVSLDVNYRALLWSPAQARVGLAPLLDHVTLLFAGAADARTIWGLDGEPADIGRALLERSSAQLVIVTAGASGATLLGRDGVLQTAPALPVDVVDPVGAGDAFAAGFFSMWLEQREDTRAALRTGAAMAALKMTMPGDLALVTPDELAAALDLLDQPGADIVR